MCRSRSKMFREKQPDLSDASWAIRFAASLDNVMMVLSGMSNMEQLEDNASMEHFVPLDEEENEIIAEAVHFRRTEGSCLHGLREMPVRLPPAISRSRIISGMYNDHCRMKKNTNGMVYCAAFPEGTGKASECTACGKCEAACPQKLPIRN